MCSSRQPPVTLDPQLVFGGRELSSLVMAQPLLSISEDVSAPLPGTGLFVSVTPTAASWDGQGTVPRELLRFFP